MAVTVNLDADLAYVDGAQDVTLRLRRANATIEVSAPNAVMGDVTRAIKSFGGVELRGDDTAWDLPDVLPTGESLSPEDEIVTADDVTYVVTSAIKLPLDAGWRALAVPRRGGVL